MKLNKMATESMGAANEERMVTDEVVMDIIQIPLELSGGCVQGMEHDWQSFPREDEGMFDSAYNSSST